MAANSMMYATGAAACVRGTYVKDDGNTVMPVTELVQLGDTDAALAQFLAAAAVVLASGGTVEEDVGDAGGQFRCESSAWVGGACESCAQEDLSFVGETPGVVGENDTGASGEVSSGAWQDGVESSVKKTGDGWCYMDMYPEETRERVGDQLLWRPRVRELFASGYAMLPSAELRELGCVVSTDRQYIHIGAGVGGGRFTADDLVVIVKAMEGTRAGELLGEMRVGTSVGVAGVLSEMDRVFGKDFSVGYSDYGTAVRSEAVAVHVATKHEGARLAFTGAGPGACMGLTDLSTGVSLADVVAGRSPAFDEWLRGFQAHVGPPQAMPSGKMRCGACGFLVKAEGHEGRCEPVLEAIPGEVLACAVEGDKLHQLDVTRALCLAGIGYTRLTDAVCRYASGVAQAKWVAEHGAASGAYTSKATRGVASRVSTQFEALYGGRRRQVYLAWLWSKLDLTGSLVTQAAVPCGDPVYQDRACEFYGVERLPGQEHADFVESLVAQDKDSKVVEYRLMLMGDAKSPVSGGTLRPPPVTTDLPAVRVTPPSSVGSGGSVTPVAAGRVLEVAWTMPAAADDEGKPVLRCQRCAASFLSKKTLSGHFRVTGHGPTEFTVAKVDVGTVGETGDTAPWKCDASGVRLVCKRCPGFEGAGAKVFSWVPGLRGHYVKKHEGRVIRQWDPSVAV